MKDLRGFGSTGGGDGVQFKGKSSAMQIHAGRSTATVFFFCLAVRESGREGEREREDEKGRENSHPFLRLAVLLPHRLFPVQLYYTDMCCVQHRPNIGPITSRVKWV